LQELLTEVVEERRSMLRRSQPAIHHFHSVGFLSNHLEQSAVESSKVDCEASVKPVQLTRTKKLKLIAELRIG